MEPIPAFKNLITGTVPANQNLFDGTSLVHLFVIFDPLEMNSLAENKHVGTKFPKYLNLLIFIFSLISLKCKKMSQAKSLVQKLEPI